MAAEGLQASLMLADRIADLPGVEVTECDGDAVPRQINVLFRDESPRRTIREPRPRRLCRLSAEGIAIFGLDNWAKHQVTLRGWGKLLHDHVLVFLPRDDDELETCWSILRQAYDSISQPSACNPVNGYASVWNLPRFSRTTLQ